MRKVRTACALTCENTGASNQTRTDDPRFTRAVLYQLSYAGLRLSAQLLYGDTPGFASVSLDFFTYSLATRLCWHTFITQNRRFQSIRLTPAKNDWLGRANQSEFARMQPSPSSPRRESREQSVLNGERQASGATMDSKQSSPGSTPFCAPYPHADNTASPKHVQRRQARHQSNNPPRHASRGPSSLSW